MSIFFDGSKRRKRLFRFTVVFFCLGTLGLTFLLFSSLFLQEHPPAPIAYDKVTDYYHYYYSTVHTKKIALTIDDGPAGKLTQEFMDVLEERSVPATFFFIGEKVFSHPSIVAEVHKRGFEVGNHSFTHSESVHKSPDRMAMEIQSTNQLLSQITGEEPLFYRPPYLFDIGIDPTLNPYIPPSKEVEETLKLGVVPVGSDIDPKDWLAKSPEEIVENLYSATQNTPNGHIVLLHEDPLTFKALPGMIDTLEAEGYTIVPLSELLVPPSTYDFKRDLALGDTDDLEHNDVSLLEWHLYEEGLFDPYLISGVFTENTRDALLRFQLQHGIVDTNDIDPLHAGVLDERTRAYIKWSGTTLEDLTADSAQQEKFLLFPALLDFSRKAYIHSYPTIARAFTVFTVLTFSLVLMRICSLFLLFVIKKVSTPSVKKVRPSRQYKKPTEGVSILIPAYNEEQNIRSTIESVLRSEYTKKEIIVIDDGSSDNTSEVIKRVILDHPDKQIRLLRKENGGKATALNLGVKMAKYRIISVLDADAVLDPSALGYFVEHFRDKNVSAVAGKIRTTNNGWNFLDTCQSVEYAVGQNVEKYALSTLSVVGVVPGPAGAWRKKDILAVGGFSSETLVEDQDMTLTILSTGKKIAYEARAISYTETPHTLENFLKQRFRWIYGTFQCFWKHRGVFVRQPLGKMSLVVMPNIFIFNMVLPVTYPFADVAFVLGLVLGDAYHLMTLFFMLTLLDMLYVLWGVWGEPRGWRMLWVVPIQRIVYRQLLYFTVLKSLVRAIEGTGAGWNKFKKSGETQRFYFASLQRNIENIESAIPTLQEAP